MVATVGHIRELLAAGAAPSDIVVLTRVNASLGPVKVLLTEEGIGATGGVGPEWLRRTGVRAALAWLRVATAPRNLDVGDLREVARRPSRGCSNKLVEWITEQRTTAQLRSLAGRLGRDKDAERVVGLADDIDRVSATVDQGTVAALTLVRSGVGLDDAVASLDGMRRDASGAHTDDLDALIALASIHPEVDGFEPWLTTRLSAPEQRDGVQLASVHAVKGREWPHVVVHDANAGVMPHRLADDPEEERRVFHVAITRCSETVVVVASTAAPSPFVAELAEPGPPPPLPERPAMRPSPAATAAGAAATRGVSAHAPSRRPAPAVPTITAELGMVIAHGGYEAPVMAVDDRGVLVQAGDAKMRIAFGEAVRVGDRTGELVGPVLAGLEDALRAWRLERSRRDGVPAYVVFHDSTLLEIATRRPSTLRALGAITGIGPTKLERYGDEVLGVVADAGA